MTLPTRDEILKKLSGAFGRASNGRAKIEHLNDDARIIEDIGLASLDLLELRCELEELWQTEFTDKDLMKLRTVGDVVHLIEDRISMRRG